MKRLLVTAVSEQAVTPFFELSGDWDITALVSSVPGMGEELIEHSPALREHRIPRPEAWARDCAFLSDKPGIDAPVIALARTAASDEALRRAFFRYASEADVIVHTSATLFDIDERCGADGKPRIYHAPAGPEFPQACQTDPAGPFTWLGFSLWAAETRLCAACTRIVTGDAAAFRLWYDGTEGKLSATWTANVTAAVQSCKPRRSLLLVNDYGVDYPGGGGHRRIRALNGCLGLTDFEVTLLCLSDESERRDTVIAPHFRQISVPATQAHRELKARMNRQGDFASDVVSLLHCTETPRLLREFRMAAVVADVVAFEHVYLAPLARLVPPGIPVVYSSQNVESTLKCEVLAAHARADDLCAAVEAAEAFLLDRADVVIAVSDEDAAYFSAAAPATPVHVIPNGVRVPPAAPSPQREGVVFTGSGHPPNVEALEFILSRLAPALPETHFVVIGSVGENVPAERVPHNVVLTGILDEEQKNHFLANAAVAINPMFSGGGSNLKLAEYFAWRLPVVATRFGARGFGVEEDVHLLLAGEEEFVQTLRNLLDSESDRARLSRAAYEYAVRELDWTVLGERRHSILDALAWHRDKELSFRPVAGGIAVVAGESELLFPASPALGVPEHVRWGDYGAEDGALRACTPASPEMERYLALYASSLTGATIAGGPLSAARILRMYGVPTRVTAPDDEPWLAWKDTLRGATSEDHR